MSRVSHCVLHAGHHALMGALRNLPCEKIRKVPELQVHAALAGLSCRQQHGVIIEPERHTLRCGLGAALSALFAAGLGRRPQPAALHQQLLGKRGRVGIGHLARCARFDVQRVRPAVASQLCTT